MSKMLFFVFSLSLVLGISGVCGQPVFSDVDTLSMPGVVGQRGEQVSVPVDLVNTFSVGGFAIRISYESTAFEPLTVDTTWRSSGFELHGANFDEPGIIRYYATSMTPLHNAIPPGSGPVAMITFLVREDVEDGFYDLAFEDEDSTSYDNQLSDSLGSNLIIPIRIGGQIMVGEPNRVGEGEYMPVAFELMQNYPNPFNLQTEVVFDLRAPADVDLAVFDILGREVAEIYSGYAGPGRTRVVWNGKSAAGEELVSGIYYYSLKTSTGESATRKMAILK